MIKSTVSSLCSAFGERVPSARPIAPVLAAVWFLAATGTASAIDIDQVIWGFDGRVTMHRFNPVSILVTNPTPEPFDGVLKLRKELGAQRMGAEVVEPLYVSQYASKWVQLYPYVQQQHEQWSISWGRGRDERFDLPEYRQGSPSPVFISQQDNLFAESAHMKHFSENLFPPMLTATDGLQTVVLDHAPRWEQSRRQAFLDWLERGGRVHLLHGPDGRYPRFPAELADLNAPFDRYRVGSGLVVRHDRPTSRIDRDFIKLLTVDADSVDPAGAAGQGEPDAGAADEESAAKESGDIDKAGEPADQNDTNEVGGEAIQATQVEPQPTPVAATQYSNYQYGDMLFNDFASGVFLALRAMTRPDHSWGLIYIMSLIYLLLVFPGIYLLGRRRIDYRLVYGALLGLVVLFSLGFATVGRRGYDESTAVHAAAVANRLPDGSLDVTGWSNAFVIRGRVYSIAHPGTGRLYSTAQYTEAVKGIINNGVDGRFDVDIPPFSSRSFTHRVKLEPPPWTIDVETWESGEQLDSLVLSTSDDFPQPFSRMAHVVYGDTIYELKAGDGRLQARTEGSRTLTRYLEQTDFATFTQYGYFMDRWETETAERRFQRLYKPLLVYNLGVVTRDELTKFSLPRDRARIFIYARMPDEFLVDSDELGEQSGYVLYSIDVFKPDEP